MDGPTAKLRAGPSQGRKLLRHSSSFGRVGPNLAIGSAGSPLSPLVTTRIIFGDVWSGRDESQVTDLQILDMQAPARFFS